MVVNDDSPFTFHKSAAHLLRFDVRENREFSGLPLIRFGQNRFPPVNPSEPDSQT